jgi:hypothetical protein
MRLERRSANAVVATILGSIEASSDTVESEGRQMNIVHKKIQKIPLQSVSQSAVIPPQT